MAERLKEKARKCKKCGKEFVVTAKGIADHAATCKGEEQ